MNADEYAEDFKRKWRRMMGESLDPEAEAERSRRSRESQKYDHLPIPEWPEFKVSWDLSCDSQHYASGDHDLESFKREFPQGLALIENVPVENLDRRLNNFSLQRPEEFWNIGFYGKKSRIILDFVEDRALTPPFIVLCEDNALLTIADGHHRLAVARARKEPSVPILVVHEQRDRIIEIVIEGKP